MMQAEIEVTWTLDVALAKQYNVYELVVSDIFLKINATKRGMTVQV